MLARDNTRGRKEGTVKLYLYVHGLVRTLGYNVLSVDHGHRQSENMYSETQLLPWREMKKDTL